MKRVIIAAAMLAVAGCAAKGQSANSADDAAQAAKAPLSPGTTVCINDLVGVRYTLEDALRDFALEPERSCMMADVQLEESGEPTAWVMRFQRVGDDNWAECKSNAQDRLAFAEQCITQMIADLGGT